MIELFQILVRAGQSTGVGLSIQAGRSIWGGRSIWADGRIIWVGRGIQQLSPEWLRAVGLFAAALVIGATLATGALRYGDYTTALYRLNARAVVLAQAEMDERPILLWRETTDTLRDGRRFRIVFMTPLTPAAATPPGVLKWPQAGEVWMSPALRKAGAAEGIERRYGRTVGTIARHGLTGPSELLAYIRPLQDLSIEQARPVVGFGLSSSHRWLNWQLQDRELEWALHPALIGGVLLSGLGLLFGAVRIRSPALDHQATVVATLGGRWVHRAALMAGQGWQLTLAGSAKGALIAVVVVWLRGSGPMTELALSGRSGGNAYLSALPSVAVLLGVAVLLSGVVTLVSAALFGGRPHRSRPGLVGRSRAVVWLVAAACPVMVLFTWYGPGLLATVPQPVAYRVGVVGAALTLPAVVALAVTGLARLWAYQGRVRGRANHLVGGRQVAAHPGAVAWLVVAVTIAVFLGWQIPVWQAASNLEIERDRVRTSVVEVAPRGSVTESQVDGFLAGLPSGTRVVVRSETGGQAASDREPSRALAQDPRAKLILSAPDGRKLSIPGLKRLAHRLLPLGAAVEPPASGPLPAAPEDGGDRWPIWLVVVTIVVIAAATGLVAAGWFLRQTRRLAPLKVFGDTTAVLRSSATWWVLVPLTLAAFAGTAMAALLAVPTGVVSALPVVSMLTCVGLIFVLGFVITEWVTLIAIHETEPQRGAASHDSDSDLAG